MSVAIRAITRVQDADDAPALGAGQNGYALTWDNASGAFVATALFTGGLLATGATTGATSQAQTFTNGIIGPSWKPSANSTTALQLQNATGTNILNVDTTNGRVGIGTTAPAAALHVYGNGVFNIASGDSERGLGVEMYADDTNAALMRFVRARGTKASPTAVASGTNIGFFRSYGYDGAAYRQTSYFGFTVDGAVSSGTVPVALVFATGTADYGAERMRITSAGRVGIGATAPAALLHADQSNTNGAVPVLTVDQADVSEEFIRFIGTSTTDASQSLVDAADMTTPGALVGWLKIYVQDDQATNAITDGAYYVPFYAAPTA